MELFAEVVMAKSRKVTTFPVLRLSLRAKLLTLLLSFHCHRALTQGSKITCDVLAAQLFQDAVLTCSFPEDLSITKKSFSVYHYDKQELSDAVLDCWWMNQKPECVVKASIEYNRTVNRHLSITLRQVTFANSGVYACQVHGYDPSSYQTCDLQIITEKPASCIVQPDTLTCNFNVDVNKTKANFKVVHVSDHSNTGVDILNCKWKDEGLDCYVTSGYEFSRPVADHVTVRIPLANRSHDGEYMCQLHNSVNNATRCPLVLESNSHLAVIVGVLVPTFILVLIVVGILLYRKCPVRNTHKQKPQPTSEENHPMLTIQVTDETTQRLQESLSAIIQTMYPDILTACYFVPSLYINRNRYTKDEVAGEKVVVMEAKSDDTLRHDHAIQHVLTCLRHLADTDQQAMFVLSQFTCDDYLASVDQQFAQHKLPMPSDLTRRDKDYENFDVLIVHRQYGVVVVVVKASVCTADMGVEMRDNERVVQDLREAVKQLDGAERMLKHLMADLRPSFAIRKTLILPNLSLKSLRDLLAKHQDVIKALRHCTGLTECCDISRECLCADQLHSDMVDQLHKWLQHHTAESSTDRSLSENNYKMILSRFCGVATRPYLTLPDGRRVCTPTSLQQAVSLTGELFNGAIIHPEHQQLVTAAPPRVFLSGPPGSGKTTSLVLMGKQWLSEGHKVCVLCTWRENRTSSKLLHAMLTRFLERDKSDPSKDMQLIFKDVDLEKTEMKNIIQEVRKLFLSDGLLILVDDAGPYREDQPLFKSFCEQLAADNKDLQLWAASCCTQQIPYGWDEKHFQRTVSCAPAILQEKNVLMLAQMKGCKNLIKWDPDSIRVVPTEGLPVKYVYHHGNDVQDHNSAHPFYCNKCCKVVIQLLEASARKISDNRQTSSTSATRSTNCDSTDTSTSTPQLHPSDVLVLIEHTLFDTNACKKTTFCKNLSKLGYDPKVVNLTKSKFLSKTDFHHLWMSNATHFQGIKRKVVVYMEGRGQSNVPLEWMRLRGVTSCTSQLIWVKDAASSHPGAQLCSRMGLRGLWKKGLKTGI